MLANDPAGNLLVLFQGSRGEVGPVGPPGLPGKLVSHVFSLQQVYLFRTKHNAFQKLSKERKTIYKGQFNHLFLIFIVMWRCEKSRWVISNYILISVVGSIHFKTGRDISCCIWPLVVLGMEESCAECCLFLLQLCLFTQQEEQCPGRG